MKHFIAVVHQEGDSAFGVHFPDVPGCFSAADTFDQVLPNAVEALQFFFEDADEIAPRDMDAIRAAAAEDLAEGAVLMAVPLIAGDEASVRVNITLPRGVLRAIDAEMAARGEKNRSAFLAEAARNEIEGRH